MFKQIQGMHDISPDLRAITRIESIPGSWKRGPDLFTGGTQASCKSSLFLLTNQENDVVLWVSGYFRLSLVNVIMEKQFVQGRDSRAYFFKDRCNRCACGYKT